MEPTREGAEGPPGREYVAFPALPTAYDSLQVTSTMDEQGIGESQGNGMRQPASSRLDQAESARPGCRSLLGVAGDEAEFASARLA